MFKAHLNVLYQIVDISESLEVVSPQPLYLCYKIVLKDLINYADLNKYFIDSSIFPESLCRKLTRKARIYTHNNNTNFFCTQNTEKSQLSHHGNRAFENTLNQNEDDLALFNNKNSLIFPRFNKNSMNLSNFNEPKNGVQANCNLSSFQDINKYIHSDELLVKKIENPKINTPFQKNNNAIEENNLEWILGKKESIIDKDKIVEPKSDVKKDESNKNKVKYEDQIKQIYKQINF